MADNIVSINGGQLSVVEHGGALVVDSRLVAERLGIQHESFLKTIRKYRERIERKFGNLRFEIGTSTNSIGASHEVTFVMLTEPQATVLMTISKNTDQVLECKFDLVDAFERAKAVIKTVIPAQSEELQKLEAENRNMEMKLKVYEAQQRTLSAAGLMALTAPALVEAVLLPGVTVIEKTERVEITVIKDAKGRTISESDGAGITAITKAFGFKSTKDTWSWLESVGYGKESGHWQTEYDAHETLKLKRDSAAELRKLFAQHRGNRQKLVGELS
jgi:anti-repressor protein